MMSDNNYTKIDALEKVWYNVGRGESPALPDPKSLSEYERELIEDMTLGEIAKRCKANDMTFHEFVNYFMDLEDAYIDD